MMPEIPPLTVDFSHKDDVLQILPHPAQRSSEDLGWNGIYIQQHRQPAWETPESAHTRHMLMVHGTPKMVRVERWFDGRREQEQFGNGNNIAIIPAMVLHRVNWDRDSSFSLLFLEPDYLIQVARELTVGNRIELIPHHAMSDPLIDRIARSLIAELESHQLGSRLFVDSLAMTLAIHLLRNYADLPQPLQEATGGLPQRKLQQAIDYINDRLANELTIAAIADELQMSQYYFSRLFKRSTGLSPYQYITQQRIERATFLLRTTSLSVAAIADRVGFSNQNQLAIQFRKFVDTTPTKYRKNLLS
jgi:AraC family transcriptional regulator